MEEKLKHLEFAQNIISRQAGNSFAVKGWSVALVAALFALSSKEADKSFLFVTYMTVPLFWLLDLYYLHLEICYRLLFDEIRTDKVPPDLDMKANRFSTWETFVDALKSAPLQIFHGLLLALVLFVVWRIH